MLDGGYLFFRVNHIVVTAIILNYQKIAYQYVNFVFIDFYIMLSVITKTF